MTEYICKDCATIQFDEDLYKTQERFDEPSWNVCGSCHSDNIEELDPVSLLAELGDFVQRRTDGRKKAYYGAIWEYLENMIA